MSSGTHSNLQSNTPPPGRGRRVNRSREPTSELQAASSEVPSILTGLLGSSPPRSRPESSSSVDQGDFRHPSIPTTRSHLPAVYNDETGDIPIGFDISHLMNHGRLQSAYSDDSSDVPIGFDTTHLVDRRSLTPAYSADSGDIPVAWILFNPLAGTAAFRPREGEARHGPGPYVSIEEIESELQDYPGTSQEWQENRAEDFYAEHRLRHQARVDEWRAERVRRASNHSPLRGLEDPLDSHHPASDAEARNRETTATEDPSRSDELSNEDRQRLINWIRSRAQQRRAAREAQEEADHDLARESSDPSSTDSHPSTVTSSSNAQPVIATAQPSNTPAAPFILPPKPEPHFLTSLNSYRYHLGSILLQPIPEEEFDEEEVRAMVNDPHIHGWLMGGDGTEIEGCDVDTRGL